MKSLFIILLLPLLVSAQIKINDKITIPDDALHFYGSFFINEGLYQIQTRAFPKWKPVRKILISNAITLALIASKERFDMIKKNPTGWSWDDIFIGCWAIPIYDIFNICRRDWMGRDLNVPPPGYFDFNTKSEPIPKSRKKFRKRWTFRNKNLLT